MVGITKIRIKLGPEGSVKTFQTFPGISICGNAKKIKDSIGEDLFSSADQSKKRGLKEVDEVQAKKKQKLDSVFSSQCFTLLRSLVEHRVGWPFRLPVDPVELNIPDYFSVISKPMDLGTIESKLLKNEYSNADEFAADVRLTFTNAMMYNPPYNSVHKFAKDLKEVFEVRWESLKKKKILELSGIKVTEGFKRRPFDVDCSKKRSPETPASSGRYTVELPKPRKEKPEKVSILSNPVKFQSKKDTLAVMPKALAVKLRIKKLDQGLGVSSAVKIPSKGSAPTAACKCDSCGRIICICLKSCNLSESDTSPLTDCHVKNTSGSQASESDPNCNRFVSSRNEKNGCVSSQLDKPSNSTLVDNELKMVLPALPPLPPEKARRAAILKSQYAETILKAKRIVLHQSDKADLIRTQIKKEQIERTQREEKARIEAEMRDAKIATRMRAQAELKQQREKERLKLEKMKKEYDFDENNHSKLEKDFINICGCSSLRRTRLLFEELGLVLRNDSCPELEELKPKIFDAKAMRVDDLEEGEIL